MELLTKELRKKLLPLYTNRSDQREIIGKQESIMKGKIVLCFSLIGIVIIPSEVTAGFWVIATSIWICRFLLPLRRPADG